jgi:tRNA threonylcarbamoyladenosine biosynthesis protein TsaE
MPILDPHSTEFISRSPEQTRRAGMRLGAMLRPGDAICLVGDLGAGKTTLVQGIAIGWGSLDQVTSPTFVLVNMYRRPDGMRLYHLDAYRLQDAQEAIDLDIDNLLEGSPLVVEWAERIREALPGEYLNIQLHYIDEQQRDLLISAHGKRYEDLLATFRRTVYGVP